MNSKVKQAMFAGNGISGVCAVIVGFTMSSNTTVFIGYVQVLLISCWWMMNEPR